MEKKEMSRIYIAGAVTGVPYSQAVADFKRAEEHLYNRGDDPVNPTSYCDVSWSWGKCMRTVIPLLCECDGIYMLKGWKQSKGAKLEHFIALKLGLKIELEK